MAIKYHIVIKKHLIFLVTTLFFLINPCSGQVWPRVYHYDYHVYFENIREDYDKGYVICGNHLLNVNKIHFGLILKTDINGNKLWEKRYGDVEMSSYFTHIEKTSDGGAIFSGATTDNDAMFDPLFLKVNACYEVEWCKIIASPSYNVGDYISVLPDGSYIGMMRYYNYNGEEIRISLIKLDATGKPVWITHLLQEDSTINNAEGYHLLVTSDNELLVSGDTGGPTPLFVLTDSAGMQLWELKWGGEQFFYGSAYCSLEKEKGIFYSTGTTSCENSPPAPAVFKFNSAGEELDDFCLLGDTIYSGWALPLCVYNDTSLLVGIEWENLTYEDGFSEILVIDTLGTIKNRRLLLEEKRSPQDIIKTFDSKILVGGTYYVNTWDIHLFKLKENLQDDTLNPTLYNYDTLCSYQIPSDTIALDCGVFVNINEIPSKEDYESSIEISPNPARDWISISFPELVSYEITEIVVHDIFGRQVMNKRVVLENNMATIDISKLSPGLYTIICNNISKSNLKGKFVVVP